MRYFPAFVDLKDGACLVVGGGPAAHAKLRLLQRTEARLTLVAPEVIPEIAAAAQSGTVTWHRRDFAPDDVRGQALVFAASGNPEVDGEVARAARAAGIQVNVVDSPEHCSFITPAIVDRDPVVIGISSAGTAPVLARRLRAQLEALLPPGLGALARFADAFRPAVGALIADSRGRRRFWERFFAGPLARRVLAGEQSGTREDMLSLVNRSRRTDESD